MAEEKPKSTRATVNRGRSIFALSTKITDHTSHLKKKINMIYRWIMVANSRSGNARTATAGESAGAIWFYSPAIKHSHSDKHSMLGFNCFLFNVFLLFFFFGFCRFFSLRWDFGCCCCFVCFGRLISQRQTRPANSFWNSFSNPSRPALFPKFFVFFFLLWVRLCLWFLVCNPLSGAFS